MTNESFLSVPPDVSDPVTLRRFLSRLLEQLDVLYRNRAEMEVVDLSSIISRLDALESRTDELVSVINNLEVTQEFSETVVTAQPVEEPMSALEALSLVRHYSNGIYASVPLGAIMFWSGAIASIPAGYALCDGNNGTPNLTDSFVVAAGNTYNPGDVGGTNQYATGDITTASVASTINSSINLTKQTINSAATGTAVDVVTNATIDVTANAHQHDVNGFSNMPKYYALAYIMRTA